MLDKPNPNEQMQHFYQIDMTIHLRAVCNPFMFSYNINYNLRRTVSGRGGWYYILAIGGLPAINEWENTYRAMH